MDLGTLHCLRHSLHASHVQCGHFHACRSALPPHPVQVPWPWHCTAPPHQLHDCISVRAARGISLPACGRDGQAPIHPCQAGGSPEGGRTSWTSSTLNDTSPAGGAGNAKVSKVMGVGDALTVTQPADASDTVALKARAADESTPWIWTALGPPPGTSMRTSMMSLYSSASMRLPGATSRASVVVLPS